MWINTPGLMKIISNPGVYFFGTKKLSPEKINGLLEQYQPNDAYDVYGSSQEFCIIH